METGLSGLDEVDLGMTEKQTIQAALLEPRPFRILVVAQAFRAGLTVDEVYGPAGSTPGSWSRFKDIVAAEEEVRRRACQGTRAAG